MNNEADEAARKWAETVVHHDHPSLHGANYEADRNLALRHLALIEKLKRLERDAYEFWFDIHDYGRHSPSDTLRDLIRSACDRTRKLFCTWIDSDRKEE